MQIPIKSVFERSVIVALPCARDDLQRLVSPHLSVDDIDGDSYFAVAVVDQAETRPQGLPAWIGLRMTLVEYLVFVTYRSPAGKELSGLALVHSETNKRFAAVGSRLLSPYGLDHVDVAEESCDGRIAIQSDAADLHIEVHLPTGGEPGTLGELAKPRAFNFVERASGSEMLINRGILKNWLPTELSVDRASVGWLDRRGVDPTGEPRAMIVEDVQYLFKRHRVDSLL